MAVFWPATYNGFTLYDDDRYVTENIWVLDGLTRAGLHWAFTTFHHANWHPLTWLSHMLDVTLFGVDPFGPHLVSVLLHACNALLLFVFLLRATGRPGRSALASILFAVHPLHVESVAWVAERKNVLYALFWMLTLNAYVSYARKPSASGTFTISAFFVLALLSKPMAVTLPVVLLLLDFWPLARAAPSAAARLVKEKIPLFVLAGLSVLVTLVAQTRGGAVGSLADYPLPVRLANALMSCIVYLEEILWPQNLAAIYSHPRGLPPLWQLAATGIIISGVSVAALCGARRSPWLGVGWFWYLVTLVPVLGLVQVGMTAHADRYTYLPIVGVIIALVWGTAALARRLGSVHVAPTLGLAILIPLVVITRAQIRTWRDSRTLLEHAIAVVPDNWVAHLTLAKHLEKQGYQYPGESQRHREAAGKIKRNLARTSELWRLPSSGSWSGESENNLSSEVHLTAAEREDFLLGGEMIHAGRFREAAARYATVVNLKPDYAEAHNNLGVALAGLGDFAGAATQFRECSRLWPTAAMPRINLANALAQQGDRAGAEASYRQALELDPDSPEAHVNLGNLYLAGGDRYKALFEYREALRVEPGHAEARRKLDAAKTPRPKSSYAVNTWLGESTNYLLF